MKGSSDKDISIAGSGSRTKTTSVAGYNALGMMLWKFSYRIEWSWTDGVITSVKGSSWPDVYAIGWEYLGLTDNTGYYINNNTGYYARRQAHMALGSGGYYIQHTYPWIEYQVYAGGDYTLNTSGD